jgi:hypothetical protein
MEPKMKYQINGKGFKTKGRITQYVRDLIAAHSVGDVLQDGNHEFISELFKRHPEADRKIGAGIKRIEIILCPMYGKNKVFKLVRVDGSSTDISWRQCVDGKPPKRDAQQALRNAVEYQISAFRQKMFAEGCYCRITGEPLGPGNSHVDHAPPYTFQRLMDDFLVVKDMDVSEVPITPPADNQTTTYLTDEAFEKEWCDFHKKNATLRLLSIKDNLSNAKAEAKSVTAPSLAEMLS